MQSTIAGGALRTLENFYIKIKGEKILFKSLPDISDTKGALYNDEPIIGRAFPLKTYSHSENRSIAMELYFYVTQQQDISDIIHWKRLIESAVYPSDGTGAPYQPPPICKLKCGKLLADDELCCVMRNYSVKYPRDVAWDEATYLPWSLQISTTFEAVYKSTDLPGQERIAVSGR